MFTEVRWSPVVLNQTHKELRTVHVLGIQTVKFIKYSQETQKYIFGCAIHIDTRVDQFSEEKIKYKLVKKTMKMFVGEEAENIESSSSLLPMNLVYISGFLTGIPSSLAIVILDL